MASAKKIKFPMHDLHFHKSLKGVFKAGIISLAVATVFCLVHNVPRRGKYQAFYSNYDACRSFERMKEGGYLQSAIPSEEEAEKNKKGGKGGGGAAKESKCAKNAKESAEKAKKN